MEIGIIFIISMVLLGVLKLGILIYTVVLRVEDKKNEKFEQRDN